MTWWMWGGVGTVDVGTPADNAPSLWSGGWAWGDDDAPFGDGTDFYWASGVVPDRTGRPRLSVAIGGELVRNQLRSADIELGRPDWLSTLAPTSASFSFVDVPPGRVNDEIVVGLMSDTTEYHSDPLWVGRVTSIRARREVDGHVYGSVSATDVVGVLGRAKAPTSIPAGHTLASLVERLALDAGVPLSVDKDPLVSLAVMGAAADLDCTVLDLVNRAERSSNALLFLRGSGRLYAAVRDSTGAASARVVTLDGADSASAWEEDTSLSNVITRWQLGNGSTWSTDTAATTVALWGDQTYSATDLLTTDPAPYADLIASDVMANPRPIVTDAPFPVTDMGQRVLWLQPLDRVSYDGTTWQVMSVRHSVTFDEWRVSITADATQEALAGAPEPGPVEPPALGTQTLTYVATKVATFERTKAGAYTGTGSGPLLAGKYSNGSRYRSAVEWAISWPVNTVRVVSAKVRFKTTGATDDGRLSLRRATDSWSESSPSWPGPHTSTTGERTVGVPSGGNRYFEASITAIAQAWFASGENNGLRIAAVNEDSVSRFATLWSDDTGDGSDAPKLTLVVEVVS